MTAALASFQRPLPPEPPMHPARRLYDAAGLHLLLQVAMSQHAPSPSELIDQLVHETDPARRRALADQIGSTCP